MTDEPGRNHALAVASMQANWFIAYGARQLDRILNSKRNTTPQQPEGNK